MNLLQRVGRKLMEMGVEKPDRPPVKRLAIRADENSIWELPLPEYMYSKNNATILGDVSRMSWEDLCADPEPEGWRDRDMEVRSYG